VGAARDATIVVDGDGGVVLGTPVSLVPSKFLLTDGRHSPRSLLSTLFRILSRVNEHCSHPRRYPRLLTRVREWLVSAADNSQPLGSLPRGTAGGCDEGCDILLNPLSVLPRAQAAEDGLRRLQPLPRRLRLPARGVATSVDVQ